jgi:hypothetical protein
MSARYRNATETNRNSGNSAADVQNTLDLLIIHIRFLGTKKGSVIPLPFSEYSRLR